MERPKILLRDKDLDYNFLLFNSKADLKRYAKANTCKVEENSVSCEGGQYPTEYDRFDLYFTRT